MLQLNLKILGKQMTSHRKVAIVFYSLTMVFQPSSEVYGYTSHALVKDGDKVVCYLTCSNIVNTW